MQVQYKQAVGISSELVCSALARHPGAIQPWGAEAPMPTQGSAARGKEAAVGLVSLGLFPREQQLEVAPRLVSGPTASASTNARAGEGEEDRPTPLTQADSWQVGGPWTEKCSTVPGA